MDPAHYGPCCVRADGVRGMKRWGDGKGSNVFKGETTYFCHMCLYELNNSWWARMGFLSEAAARAQCEGVLRRVHAARLAPAACLAQHAAPLTRSSSPQDPRASHYGARVMLVGLMVGCPMLPHAAD